MLFHMRKLEEGNAEHLLHTLSKIGVYLWSKILISVRIMNTYWAFTIF